ncbi:protoglobin family protein [Sorangium sp. So ce131]|uniref:protoglobin family protein n=1 Tax=Sorangium sp. So ce131 TaxID=3133282 RepID=UPI003F64624C
MKHIDEKRLESELEYRFAYLVEFVGFGEEDIAAIHGAALHLAPRVEALVDAVYEKLFLYDATKRHFVPKQHGYEGNVPRDLSSLTLDHEQIRFRKAHLRDYLVRLVTHAYDAKMVSYLDMVGRIHTAKAGNPEVVVPLVQINALMGFVSDALLQTILSLGLDRDTEVRTLRAFNKLLWLQNDLLARHYLPAA